MAETIKSALLVDYESLTRSLAGADGVTDTRLADRAPAWLAAIETGRLIGPGGARRRLVVKKCYAGPSVLGKQRDTLTANGFSVVDCGANEGVGRNPADLYLAMDTIDVLSQPNGAEEFILLTAGSDLGPLLSRLKASKRSAVIYADRATPAAEKALADALLERDALAAFLASEETPLSGEVSAKSAADRAEIEAFARRIHGATNIPLFSPKTYAELFKHLTDEVRENGYHFQTTAKSVAERMTATGRNVTRRQVVFIVKGLALKGHVFSTTDTPDTLAEVFREQARYLISNAGMSLDDRQDQLLSAWFVSRAPAAPEKPRVQAPPPPPRNGTQPAAQAEKPAPAAAAPPPPQPLPIIDVEVDDAPQPPAAPALPPPPAQKPLPQVPPPIAVIPRPQAQPQKPIPAYVRPVELPKSTAKPQQPVKTSPSPAAREEAKAVIAARIAASAKLKPTGKGGKPGPRPAAAPAPAPKAPPIAKKAPAEPPPPPPADALESSILAAIAEAVDVLVDDGAADEIAAREAAPPPPRRKPSPKAAEPEPAPTAREPDPEQEGDEEAGGDIGDQIQRIIASYNRNRSDE